MAIGMSVRRALHLEVNDGILSQGPSINIGSFVSNRRGLSHGPCNEGSDEHQ